MKTLTILQGAFNHNCCFDWPEFTLQIINEIRERVMDRRSEKNVTVMGGGKTRERGRDR